MWGVYHELEQERLSPTINLWFEPDDFLKFIENIKRYLSLELIEESTKLYDYPVGRIGDIHLYFIHYHSFDEAKEKWKARSKRINFDNVYVVIITWSNSSCDLYERFECLPYKNKDPFTIKEHLLQ